MARTRGVWRLASSRRFRLQGAGLVVLGFVVLLAVLFPPRTVRIAVDGQVASVSSRTLNDEAVIGEAGIDLGPGDVAEPAGEDTLVVRRATEVELHVDGKTFALRTQAEKVAEALVDAEVLLEPGDRLLRNGTLVAADSPVLPPTLGAPGGGGEATNVAPVRLEVRRGVPFSVIENGQRLEMRSSSKTVLAALGDVGVRLGPGDEMQPSPSTELTSGLRVHIEHAAPLLVTLPDGEAMLYTLAGTVGDALEESGIELPADYRVEPPPEVPIAAGLAVHVIGISQERTLETERIQSYTVYEPDPSLPPGGQRVVAGQDGVLYRQYTVEFEDDEVVSRELTGEWYDPVPEDTVVYYSTAQEVVASPLPPQPPTFGGSWSDLVCSYDWDCSWALAVIACESGGNPSAYNPAGPYVGLFQIWGGFGANLEDPAVNIAAAYSLYRSGGAGHWPNCP